MDRAKPYDIPKREVWEAYKKVRANQGAAGVDGQTISDFEADLANNLYKLWNRLSSGSYLPPPVRRVDIPKSDGKTRPLGIPTVADRIAQMVVKRHLEPLVEPRFHPNSYGYRPGKSALDAVDKARQRCWRRDWILDLDIKAFFDSIETDLLMRPAQLRSRRSDGPSGAGRCTGAATRPLRIWRGCSTRTSGAGSTTTVGFVLRPSIQPCCTSTGFWRDGRPESLSPCAGTSDEPETGCCASRANSRGFLLTGA